jgi:MoaA/NifB/PqqE/SkfB family radical SAM enzyme
MTENKRFIYRKEKWGGIVQDIKKDRVWALDIENMENFENNKNICFTDNMLLENPFKFDSEFFLGKPIEIDDFELSAPIGVSWELTKKCNSKCIFCCNDAGGSSDEECSVEQIEKIVDVLKEWGCIRVIVGGGEPFVREDIREILEIFKRKNFKPAIATNGIKLNDEYFELINDVCITLQISLDTLKEEIYQRLRGVDACGLVKKAIEKYGRKTSNMRVVTVVNKYNIDELEDIAEFLENNGVTQWFVFKMLPAGRGIRVFDELVVEDNLVENKLKNIKNKFKNLAVWYWGSSVCNGLAVYITEKGRFVIVDYLKNKTTEFSEDMI